MVCLTSTYTSNRKRRRRQQQQYPRSTAVIEESRPSNGEVVPTSVRVPPPPDSRPSLPRHHRQVLHRSNTISRGKEKTFTVCTTTQATAASSVMIALCRGSNCILISTLRTYPQHLHAAAPLPPAPNGKNKSSRSSSIMVRRHRGYCLRDRGSPICYRTTVG